MSVNFVSKFIKNRLKRALEPQLVYYIFTRVTFPLRNLQAKLLNILVGFVRRSLIKKETKALHLLAKTTVLELVDGRKYYWQPQDRFSLHGLIQEGEFESSDAEYIKEIIKPGDFVFDIGANYGFYTVLLARLVGNEGQVHSFEPQKEVYKELVQNVVLNNIEKIVFANQCGLSDKIRQAKIYSYHDLGVGAGSLKKRWIGKPKVENCQLITLDSYIKRKKIPRVDFIKCDIEGAELLMLRGAIATLKKFVPDMMIEITSAASDFGHKREEVFSFLKERGYFFYTVDKKMLIEINEEDHSQYHGNCFCFTKAKLK